MWGRVLRESLGRVGEGDLWKESSTSHTCTKLSKKTLNKRYSLKKENYLFKMHAFALGHLIIVVIWLSCGFSSRDIRKVW